ncbi:unnamed protein product [Didymodactylos carnosus]|uniref:Uncharacterized protein n=1 Tax=Didymodactylos carnosus TaxID=1234261 RepID=A0A814AGZ9_9BILA|nr:unnamed protein product [Didymodactylos carnosus]CAF0940930.1 unnamed protein product [Didymodactylos carnosus]CAF3692698.1 unnamed protein product [Didymodactylos carnosus]CAF3716054.1 unnamed protein product [Didymodactylos carnosus]
MSNIYQDADDFEVLTVESTQPFEIIDATDLNTNDKQSFLLTKSEIRETSTPSTVHANSSQQIQPVITVQLNASPSNEKKLIENDDAHKQKSIQANMIPTTVMSTQNSLKKSDNDNKKISVHPTILVQQPFTINEQLELLKKKEQTLTYLPKRYGAAANIPHTFNDSFDANSIIDKTKSQTSNYLLATNGNNNILDLLKKK